MDRAVLVPLVLALTLAGCREGAGPRNALLPDGPDGGDSARTASTGPGAELPGASEPVLPEAFARSVDHPFLPLEPGTLLVYEGFDDGLQRRDEVRVLEASLVDGVRCTPVEQHVYLEGALSEVTTEWFARDMDGNVWKFGEESLEVADAGGLERTPDSWVAGVGGARPWMFLPAEPRVGDVIVGYRPGGRELLQVLSLDATAVVPAGTFENALQLSEESVDEEDGDEQDDEDEPNDTDIVIYSMGVGLVSEESPSGRIELVRVDAE